MKSNHIGELNKEQMELLEPYLRNNMKKLKNITRMLLLGMNEKLYECDYDDFYSIANMTIWQAIMEYKKSRKCKFNTFLYFCLRRKFKTEIRDRHRDKRKINFESYSLEYMREKQDYELSIIDLNMDLDYVIEKNQTYIEKYGEIKRYFPAITDKQINILGYLYDGYKANEIQNILNISRYEYIKNIRVLSSYIKLK